MNLCAALSAMREVIASSMNHSFHAISVVIRTKNSAATLGEVITGLGLTGEDELIVVDSGSQDDTLNIATAAGATIVDLSQKPFSYGKSLNAGFAVARNAWILAISSHCIPAELGLLDLYRQWLPTVPPEVVGIAGGVVGSANEIKKNPGLEACTPADFARGVYFTCNNPNSLYRQTAWAKHPFDEQIETAEDLEWSIWALKSGHSLMRNPKAAVLYRSRLGLVAMIKKGHLEARVAKRLVPNPPFTVAYLIKNIFWNGVSVVRGQISIGLCLRRICYLLGDFGGRRT